MIAGGALLLAAYRAKSAWVKASLAGLGLSAIGIFLLAIVPSWWLYYADGRMKWGGQGCVEFNVSMLWRGLTDGKIRSGDTYQCLKQTLKDTIVVVENAAIVGVFVIAFSKYQKKFPKQLAPGEGKPEATGGYK